MGNRVWVLIEYTPGDDWNEPRVEDILGVFSTHHEAEDFHCASLPANGLPRYTHRKLVPWELDTGKSFEERELV